MEPRCIVEIRWGPLAGTKTWIPPGGALRVGRSQRADLVAPRDSRLSAIHFCLTWDGARCSVTDLDSALGTRLEGELVKREEVKHGAWIRAGLTDFTVHVEGRTPPPPEDPAALPGRVRYLRKKQRAAAETALATLRAEQAAAPLYAVLDASRSARILTLLREAVEPHRSLYQGAQGDSLEDVAPYLVGPFEEGSRLLERLVHEGWGLRWGIYATSAKRPVELRRHLRRFLVVEILETGERVYFRYYDPRVLRRFLPTCSLRQEEELFGDIQALLLEGERGQICRLTPMSTRARVE